jgi:phosphoribosylglycinamide formyltransferase 2
MVTLAGTQTFSEFELHARAILGLPIPSVSLVKNGASAVVLADRETTSAPDFSGLDEVLSVDGSDIRLFGKPTARPYRRMGVVLYSGDEAVEEITQKAKDLAAKITLVY